VTVALRDGTPLAIRPVEPGDREAIAAGFERLSPESRYRRFFGPMPRLGERDLDYLTRVDHHDHEALVGFEPGGEAIGVARYVRTGADVAEPAMAVVDDWHGRWVGTALLEALVERGREEGIARFEAPVLATNREAIALLERLGATSVRRTGPEVLLEIDLAEERAARADWRALLRTFAEGALEPARELAERVLSARASGSDSRP
jgi:GNAT superfamily N-acetyltransferase